MLGLCNGGVAIVVGLDEFRPCLGGTLGGRAGIPVKVKPKTLRQEGRSSEPIEVGRKIVESMLALVYSQVG